MPELLFRLRGVPEDEAEEVRALLSEHGIRYYETDEGNWKIAVPAIWLPDREQLAEAKRVLAVYQGERRAQARQAHLEQQATGQMPTIWGFLKAHPLRFVAYLMGVAVVLYLTLMPFITFGS